MLRQDGSTILAQVTNSPVHDDDGKPVGVVAVATDVTEEKRARLALLEEQRVLGVLNRTAVKLNAELDLTALMQAVADAGVELTGAEFGALFSGRKSREDDHFELYAAFRNGARCRSRRCRCRRKKGWSARFSATGRSSAGTTSPPIRDIAESIASDALRRGSPFVRSYLAVPLVSRSGKVIGALFLGHRQPGVFTERTERIIEGIASHATIAIEKASLFQAAQQEIETRKKGRRIAEQERSAFPRLRRGGLRSPVGDRRAVPHHLDRRRFALGLRPRGGRAHRKDGVGIRQGGRDMRRSGSSTSSTTRRASRFATSNIRSSTATAPCAGFRPTAAPITTSREISSASAAPPRTSPRASTRRRSSRQARASSSRPRCSASSPCKASRATTSTRSQWNWSRARSASSSSAFSNSPATSASCGLRAGSGWPSQSVNIRAVPLDYCPPLARGISSDVPVHFSRRNFNLIPGLQNDKGSGVALPIGEKAARIGVLVVCSDGFRAFSETDINFLRAISFVLAADAEQRKAEATLRLRDRALEAIGEGIMITDAAEFDNPVTYVNPAFERLTGYTQGGSRRAQCAIPAGRGDRQEYDRECPHVGRERSGVPRFDSQLPQGRHLLLERPDDLSDPRSERNHVALRRHSFRRDRTHPARVAIAAGAEDGIARAPDRRRRARLQQSPRGDPRQFGDPLRGDHRPRAEGDRRAGHDDRREGRGPDAAPARLRTSTGAAPRAARCSAM